jgi:hypothetical protein
MRQKRAWIRAWALSRSLELWRLDAFAIKRGWITSTEWEVDDKGNARTQAGDLMFQAASLRAAAERDPARADEYHAKAAWGEARAALHRRIGRIPYGTLVPVGARRVVVPHRPPVRRQRVPLRRSRRRAPRRLARIAAQASAGSGADGPPSTEPDSIVAQSPRPSPEVSR